VFALGLSFPTAQVICRATFLRCQQHQVVRSPCAGSFHASFGEAATSKRRFRIELHLELWWRRKVPWRIHLLQDIGHAVVGFRFDLSVFVHLNVLHLVVTLTQSLLNALLLEVGASHDPGDFLEVFEDLLPRIC
jgi:hypothetical protein